MHEFEVKKEKYKNICIIRFNNENVDINMHNTMELSFKLKTIIAEEENYLAFDFSKVVYIDSSGIGTFINIASQLRASNGDIFFFNMSPKTNEVFKLTKLTKVFKIIPTEKEFYEAVDNQTLI